MGVWAEYVHLRLTFTITDVHFVSTEDQSFHGFASFLVLVTSCVGDLVGLVEVVHVPRELVPSLVLFLVHVLLRKELLVATLLGLLLDLSGLNFVALLVLVLEGPCTTFFLFGLWIVGGSGSEAGSVLVC
jgi:hypothetical protein